MLRAGIGVGITDLLSHAAGGGEMSLDDQLESMHLRVYPFSVLPVTKRLLGFTQAGGNCRLEAPNIILEGPSTPAANKIAEYAIEYNATDAPFEGPLSQDWFQYAQEMCVLMGPYGMFNPTATQFAGIELASMGVTPPLPAAPSNACAQLRYNSGTGNFELLSAVGDGVTASTVVTKACDPTGVDPTKIPFDQASGGAARLRLKYDPHIPAVIGTVNGVEVGRITDTTKLPQYGAYATDVNNQSWGIFTTTGTNAAGHVQVFFSYALCKNYDYLKAPAALWY